MAFMQRKIIFTFLMGLISSTLWAQFGSADVSENSTVARDPVSFSHQPVLLLKFTPTALIGRDNVWQVGAELAPPFGKFSFNFDYGKGKGSSSWNKSQKANHPEQKTSIFRGEIRGYFSDWYPFYALDKKPFGRYYALEFVQKNLEYESNPEVLLYTGATIPGKKNYHVKGVERALNLKFGKHFIVNRFFFVDAFVGIGLGQYSNSPTDAEVEQEKQAFTTKPPVREFNYKGLFLSKTAGIRLCLAL